LPRPDSNSFVTANSEPGKTPKKVSTQLKQVTGEAFVTAEVIFVDSFLHISAMTFDYKREALMRITRSVTNWQPNKKHQDEIHSSPHLGCIYSGNYKLL